MRKSFITLLKLRNSGKAAIITVHSFSKKKETIENFEMIPEQKNQKKILENEKFKQQTTKKVSKKRQTQL